MFLVCQTSRLGLAKPGNRDSFVKGTRLSVLILAKSQAGRKFEVLEGASLVSVYIQLFQLRLSDQLELTRQDRRVVLVVANQKLSEVGREP